jgi:hypothetical protein
MKNVVFWDVKPVSLVRTDVSEGLCASINRVTRNGELGTTLVTTKILRNIGSYKSHTA